MAMVSDIFTTFWGFIFCWFIYFTIKILRFGSREKYLPPGPSTWPIIGNANLMLGRNLGKRFLELSVQYGPVFSLKIGKGTAIIITSRHAIHALVDKRSSLYAARPKDDQMHAALKGEAFSVIDPNSDWRIQRKIVVRFLTSKRLDGSLAEIAEAEATTLLHDIVNDSKNFSKYLDRAVASSSSIAVFGQRAKDCDDFWARASIDAVEAINSAVTPGSYLPTEEFTILKWIPRRWLGSNARAEKCFHTMTSIWTEALKRVEMRRNKGDRRECMVDGLLDEEIKIKYARHFDGTKLANFFGTVMEAAGETTTHAMRTNILFLAKHPWIQEKARKEIDALCGTKRMPTFADFKKLPYINCIVKEGLRIRPIIPTGLPHRCTADNWYEGMLIPKDATVWVASYALNHTEYDDPENYNPDRYLGHSALASEYAASSDYQNRDHYTYGAGRRVCAGMPLAERTQWRLVACLLWAFRIEQCVDSETGEKFELDIHSYNDDLVGGPMPFKAQFAPRSEEHVRLIETDMRSASELLKKWE